MVVKETWKLTQSNNTLTIVRKVDLGLPVSVADVVLTFQRIQPDKP